MLSGFFFIQTIVVCSSHLAYPTNRVFTLELMRTATSLFVLALVLILAGCQVQSANEQTNVQPKSQQHIEALMAEGKRYSFGEGVTKDYGKAMDVLLDAAHEGYVPAQRIVGFYLMNGYGAPQDRATGFS